ncbi:MAG: cytochrome-c peroxidase [Pirellulales bacterium]|nr:cytochrome-c peroxidase [Pirellulales bacterium]
MKRENRTRAARPLPLVVRYVFFAGMLAATIVALWQSGSPATSPASAASLFLQDRGQQPVLRPVPRDILPAELEIDWQQLFPGTMRNEPEDNPVTLAKVALGRRLFFDPILSDDGTVACASCHDPRHAFATPDRVAIGIRGQVGKRNSPSLLNVALGSSFFWDARTEGLEAQALEPISNPLELGSDPDAVVMRLAAHAEYPALFQDAFGSPVSKENLARAIASFERVLASSNNGADRFHNGEITALSVSAKQGLWLFESRGRCWMCHSDDNLTDNQLHNTGVSWGEEPLDLGRFEQTEIPTDRGRFKTPSLRDVARTAPYMHDGSLATLEDVVEFYDRGGVKNPYLDELMQPLNLSEDDKRHLVDFLRELNGQIDWGTGAAKERQPR